MSDNKTLTEAIEALKTDGIVHGIALMCVNSLTQAARIATPEAFIQMAARQVDAAGQKITAESVAACLHTMLKFLDMGTKNPQRAQQEPS